MDGDIQAVGLLSHDTYGLMSIDGEPTPACLAKQLFAQHVRYGDCIRFPARNAPDVDSIVAWDDDGPPQRRIRQHDGHSRVH